MFLRKELHVKTYTRNSKLGSAHTYTRTQTICIFRCDSCGTMFSRAQSKMSPKRLNNNYFHCCSACDSKRFAQAKGVDRRTIWDRLASSLDDISKL